MPSPPRTGSCSFPVRVRHRIHIASIWKPYGGVSGEFNLKLMGRDLRNLEPATIVTTLQVSLRAKAADRSLRI